MRPRAPRPPQSSVSTSRRRARGERRTRERRTRGRRATLRPRAKRGAEWWTQVIDPRDDIGVHWDKDYALEPAGVNLHPHVGTVTYVGASTEGAPTLVARLASPRSPSANPSPNARRDGRGRRVRVRASYPFPETHRVRRTDPAVSREPRARTRRPRRRRRDAVARAANDVFGQRVGEPRLAGACAGSPGRRS